jgi:hypothetical protein
LERPSPTQNVQYFPERRGTAPQAVGLPEAEEAVLDTADGDNSVQVSSSSSAFASFRSSVSKPSVNDDGAGGDKNGDRVAGAPRWVFTLDSN